MGPTLGSPYLELCGLPGSGYLFSYPNNGTSPPIYLQKVFCHFLSLLLLGFHGVNVSLLDVVPSAVFTFSLFFLFAALIE